MSRLVLSLVLGLLVLIAGPARAEDVWLLGSDEDEVLALAAALRPALPPGKTMALQRLGDGAGVQCPGASLVLTVDVPSTRAALRGCPQARVWAIGLPSMSIDAFRLDDPERLSGLVSDQPPARQVALLNALRPRPRQVAVPYSPIAEGQARAAARALRAGGFQPILLPSQPESQPLRPLREVLGEVQAVLALPDPALYHEGLLKHWLLMTAREGVPMIGGLCLKDVRRGVAAAVVHSDKAAIRQTLRLLPELLGSGPLPEIQPVDEPRVVHNPVMLDRLGLRLVEGG
ncbi:MAG TPA: hypothetical protein ENO16_03660 [Chromatiales bacterium]|nr:hypothetical protein [Chromatiales bacterium]